MIEYTFSKTQRLLKKTDFDSVFARKASVADGMLIVYACENDRNQSRLGLVVSRKVGNAVVRNRWKRLVREAFRLAQHDLPKCDFVVLPRGKQPPEFMAVQISLKSLSARAAKRLTKTESER